MLLEYCVVVLKSVVYCLFSVIFVVEWLTRIVFRKDSNVMVELMLWQLSEVHVAKADNSIISVKGSILIN